MLTGEQVFDMLPSVVDLWDKLEIDNYRKELTEKYKGKKADQKEIGIEVFKYMLKNSGKVKEEIFGIVAAVNGNTIEEVKKKSFVTTFATFKEVLSDKEAMDFFKQAVQ